MENRIQLDKAKLEVFKNAIAAMVDFKSVFHRDLELSFVAELYAAEKLELAINIGKTERGFDAIDKSGKRYEIKCRSLATLNVDVNNFDFDYLILVNLDDNYRLIEMWRITSNQAKEIFTFREKFRKYQATQKALKNFAKRI